MLNPKKSNFLIKELAEELNLPESEVSDAVSYYWSSIRKLMESGEEPKIDVESLGVFYVKTTSLNKEIQKHEDYVRIINPTTYPSRSSCRPPGSAWAFGLHRLCPDGCVYCCSNRSIRPDRFAAARWSHKSSFGK